MGCTGGITAGIVVVLAGGYLTADAYDVVPGLLTTAPAVAPAARSPSLRARWTPRHQRRRSPCSTRARPCPTPRRSPPRSTRSSGPAPRQPGRRSGHGSDHR
ncbi:hypothetical protein NKG05_18125 [Oerskovia sp. M15]